MTIKDKNELLRKLKLLEKDGDTETAHATADDLLLEWIDDPEITEAYNRIDKWYA